MQKCESCPLRDLPGVACAARHHPRYCDLQGRPAYRDIVIAESLKGHPEIDPATLPPAAAAAPRARPAGRWSAPFPAPDGRLRVGLWCPVLNLGGAESWQLTLADSVDPARVAWQGCAVLGGEAQPELVRAHSARMPLGFGDAAARELASRCDVVVQWAIDRVEQRLAGLARRPVVVAVSHSPEESPWAMQIYRDPRGIDRFVAVHELALPPIPGRLRGSAKIIWNAVTPARLEPRRSRDQVRDAWRVPRDARVVGYLGRLEDDKDPLALARAIVHLPEDTWAVVVGRGLDLADVERQHPRFRWIPGDPDAGSVLHAFDTLLVPSAYESFGLTLCEGLWCGVPTISTRVGVAKTTEGLTRPIHPRAPGEAIALAVLQDRLDAEGTAARVARARDWAREKLDPGRFGREWTDFLLEVARPRPAVAAIELDPIRVAIDTCPDRLTCSCREPIVCRSKGPGTLARCRACVAAAGGRAPAGAGTPEKGPGGSLAPLPAAGTVKPTPGRRRRVSGPAARP